MTGQAAEYAVPDIGGEGPGPELPGRADRPSPEGESMIIAIDPGNEQSAYVMWDGVKIWGCAIEPNWMVSQVIKKEAYNATRCVIEMIASYGMPVGKEVFETCVWIGRFAECSFAFNLLYRKDVKMHLCNSMRAKDSNIRQALIDRFGAPGTKKNPGLTYGLKKDLWSAFATGVTWVDQN